MRATTLPMHNEAVYRRNFPFFLVDFILFSVALNTIGMNTLIPDFVRQLTDSEMLIGFSGSIFTAGFTLPQLFVARYIVRSANKKWWFVGPNIPVRFVVLLFALVTVALGPNNPELILVAFFVAYSIAAFGDGLVGVPWADLISSSLDEQRRARMFGFGQAITALLMLGIAPLIALVLSDEGPAFPNNYALVFAAAGLIFAASIIPGLYFHELPSGKAVESLPNNREFLAGLTQVVRDDAQFRNFIIMRILTAMFLMAIPFYIGFATEELGLSSSTAVPILLTMQTLGGMIGSLAYAWIGARQNLTFLRGSFVLMATLPLSAIAAAQVGPAFLYGGFLLSGLVLSIQGMAFLNWVVVYAAADDRPLYVGLSNTVAAVFSLVAPIIGGLVVEVQGYQTLFVISCTLTLMALTVAVRGLQHS